MLSLLPADVVLAWVIVIAMAGVGFNQPSWSRSSTTAFRYHGAQMGHMGLYSVIFFLAYGVFWLLGASPFVTWLALLLTLALRATPFTARFLRRRAHGWASIPESVQRLSRVLGSASISAPAFTGDARLLLTTRGIVLDDDESIPAVKLAKEKLLAATEVFLTIRSWEDSREAARFSLDMRPSIDLLRHRYDRLAFRAAHTMTSIERLGDIRFLYVTDVGEARDTTPMDDLLRRLVDDMTDEMLEDIRAFHTDACVLAARGTLAMRLTRHGRDALIARMGFDLGHKRGPAMGWLLAGFAVLVVGSLAGYFVIAPQPANDPQQGLSFGARFLLLTLDIFCAITIAVIPKRHWGFANSGLWQKTPKMFVLAAGCFAMASTIAINTGIGAILDRTTGAAQGLDYSWVLLPFMFAHAAAAAWLIQDHRWLAVGSGVTRRVRDASIWALALAVASLVAIPIILTRDIAHPFALLPPLMLTSLVFGGFYGWFVPEAVRSLDAPRAADESGTGLVEFAPASLRRYVE
jgi:hypothetical protein